MARRGVEIQFRGRPVRVEYEVVGADPSVGIMGDYGEDFSLHDPETEEPLGELEETVTDDEWDEISIAVDEAGGYKYEPMEDDVI